MAQPPHADIEVSSAEVVEPSQEGIRAALGEPRGQLKDYEINLPDDRRVHIRKFKESYLAHWDFVSPSVNPLEHLRRDAPPWYVAAAAGAGSSMGGLVAGGRKGAVMGSAMGGLVGLVLGLLTR